MRPKKLKEPLQEPNSFLATGQKIDEAAFFKGYLRPLQNRLSLVSMRVNIGKKLISSVDSDTNQDY
jgi:hypothetical protein